MFGIAVVILLASGLVYFLLNSPAFQTFVTGKIAGYFSRELNTEILVGKVSFKPFRTLVLEEVLVKDQQLDTLAYFNRLEGRIGGVDLENNRFLFTGISMKNPVFNLVAFEDSDLTNLTFLLDYFSTSDTVKSDVERWFEISELDIENGRFSYYDHKKDPIPYGVDYDHVDVKNLNLHVDDFILDGDTIIGDLIHLSLLEKSGFVLDTLQTRFKLSGKELDCKNVKVKTANSSFHGNLHYDYDSWRDYRNFNSNVNMQYQIEDADIFMGDVAFFAPELEGWTNNFTLSGNVRGEVNNLKGRNLKITYGDHTQYEGSVDLTGLPDFSQTFINLSVNQLQTHPSDLVDFQLPPFNEGIFLKLPEELEPFGFITFTGSFTGFPNEFVAFGQLNSRLGVLKTDIELRDLEDSGNYAFSGRLKMSGFEIGHLADVNELGKINANLEVDASGTLKNLSGNAKGTVNSLVYKNYSYKNIRLDGNFSSGLFNGIIASKDPNLNFDFDGLVDYSSEIPVFDFIADLYHVDLKKINILEGDEWSSLSGRLMLNASGADLDNFNGLLRAENLLYCEGDEEYEFNNILLTAQQSQFLNKISLSSDFADVSLLGNYEWVSLPQSILQLLHQVFPANFDGNFKELPHQDLDFSVTIKDFHYLAALFFPGLEIDYGTVITGSMNTEQRGFGIFVRSERIKFNQFVFNEVNLDAEKISEVLYLSGFVDNLQIKDSLNIENVEVESMTYRGEMENTISWQNIDSRSEALLAFNAWSHRKDQYGIEILPSNLSMLAMDWEIPDTALIRIDSTSIDVADLILTSGRQYIDVYGKISSDSTDVLYVNVDSLDLDIVNNLQSNSAPNIGGILNLNATMKDMYNSRIVESNASISSLVYDNYQIGDAFLSTVWNRMAEAISTEGQIVRDDFTALNFEGRYFPSRKSESLDLLLKFNEFELSVLNSLDLGIISEVEGEVFGTVSITGTLSEPVLDGIVDFNNTSFRVDYLNTRYTYNDEVRIGDGWIGIDYKPIYDINGNKGSVVAQAFHEDFKNWNFDAYVEVEDFMLLNTTAQMNNLYYGSAYGTGSVQFGGYLNNLEINIDITTERNTVLKLPLTATEEIALENFINFTTSGTDVIQEEPELDLTGIDMSILVHTTPDAEIQLIFDEQVGDVLRARGTGELTFEISPAGDFSMYGPFEIYSGDYLFTLQGVINKRFTLNRGGYIQWYGDPYEAFIDISASYRTRTSLHDIMLENPDAYRARTPVDVVMKLTNRLFNPDIAFDIDLPSSSEVERSQLESIINVDQERNKQVFALLVLNRFLPPTGSSQQANFSVTSATTSDFVSNQLSNWLSQLSNSIDIGVNYRPGDNATNEEMAVALSTQLFNERLLVSGNFGVSRPGTNTITTQQNELIGDFELQYLITEDGRFRLKVFNRSNTYDIAIANPTGFTQGVGVIYQQDFDTFEDLMGKVKGLFQKN